MMKKTTFAMAALAAVAFTGTAQAQMSLPLSFEGRVGAVLPTGDWGELAKTGIGLNGNVTFNVTPVVGVYGGYTWNRFDVDDDLGGEVEGTKWTEQGFDVGLKARFAAPTGMPVTPFFRGGAIIHKMKVSDSDVSFSTDYKVGFDVGGGVEIPLAPKITLTPQVGYSQFNPGDDDETDDGNIDVTNVHLGIGLNIRL